MVCDVKGRGVRVELKTIPMNYQKETLKNGLRVITTALAIAIVIGGFGIGLVWKTDYLDRWVPASIKELFRRGEKPEEGLSVLYVYKQFSPNKEPKVTKIFKSDISGRSRIELDIEYNEDIGLRGTKDGKYLERWSGNKLEITSSKQLDSFNKVIEEVFGANEGFGGAVWAGDGSKLAYIVTKHLEPEIEWGAVENRLYLINRDGTERKLVGQFREPLYVSLEGLNLVKNELYWLEAGTRSLAVVSLTGGTIIKRIKVGLTLPVHNLNFSSDFSSAYYIDDGKIIEHGLVSDKKRILYELSGRGKDEFGNESFIDRLRLSPKDDLLVFTQVNEPSDKEITYSITLPDGQINVLLDDPRYYNVGPFFWSPDGRYLWFETFCHGCGRSAGYDNEGEYYIIDLSAKSMNLFFKGGRDDYSGDLNESIEFISWLVE